MPFNAGGPVTDYLEEVGAGWRPLLSQLHEELAVIWPDYQTVQVKEKFGTLRVYLDGCPTGKYDEIFNAVGKYESMSAVTCEYCGQPGTQTKTVWIKTLCLACTEQETLNRRKFWEGLQDD